MIHPTFSQPVARIVAYQGEPGAYSEEAVIAGYQGKVQPYPCLSFEKVFDAVLKGETDQALLPFENSLAGSIHRNYDLILRHELTIVGEYHLRVKHCLMAVHGVTLDQITHIHSHPQALAQCERHIQELAAKPIIEADTAGSARMIKEKNLMNAGAIASQRAAEVYGLNILMEGFEDNTANYTRFLALAKTSGTRQDLPTSEFKTSIVFNLDNKPGQLFRALSVFALRDIDLTKIESRPIQGKPFEYMFYVDFEGHGEDMNCARALEHLRELAPFLRVLGSYPRHRQGGI